MDESKYIWFIGEMTTIIRGDTQLGVFFGLH